MIMQLLVSIRYAGHKSGVFIFIIHENNNNKIRGHFCSAILHIALLVTLIKINYRNFISNPKSIICTVFLNFLFNRYWQ